MTMKKIKINLKMKEKRTKTGIYFQPSKPDILPVPKHPTYKKIMKKRK